jgi:hypothetical protein
LVSDIKGRTQAEGVLKQGAQKNVWTEEGGKIGAWRKLHDELPELVPLTKYN